MNWKAIGKVLGNIALAFGAAYGTALAGGMSPKAAIAAGAVGAITNQAGLHQTAPGSLQ